eukprot:5831759-Amphidinium_carterae.2
MVGCLDYIACEAHRYQPCPTFSSGIQGLWVGRGTQDDLIDRHAAQLFRYGVRSCTSNTK